MAEKLRVLVIEDSGDDTALILRTLRNGGFDPDHLRVETAAGLAEALDRQKWDLVLSDHALPGFSGLVALEMVRNHAPDLPFILVSGAVGEETATEVMRKGARDYVMKDKLARLVPAIRRELTESRDRQLRRQTEKLLQAQLNQAQKMEAIGALAGGVAHDFNNLLTVIRGYAEIALTRVEAGQPGHEELEGILLAARRSADLTRQLLAFARRQPIKPQRLDLNQTVADMFRMLRRLIGEDIELRWRPAADLWPVSIDLGQVDQIMANLCVNARDALDDKGWISIETGNIDLDEEYCTEHADCKPGAYVQLTVSDNGAGMDRETREHIFEPFFTTKSIGKGTGLGLATVYGIVKQNHGFINCYSEPGQGTIFRIYLPRQDESRVEAPKPTLGLPAGGHETVLLVEDEEEILSVTTTILKGLGYRVLAVSSPVMALKLAAEYPARIDLLLSDVVMPELNGQELARKIVTLKPGIRCLFMSGYTADVITNSDLVKQGINFLPKPFSSKELAAKVRSSLD